MVICLLPSDSRSRGVFFFRQTRAKWLAFAIENAITWPGLFHLCRSSPFHYGSTIFFCRRKVADVSRKVADGLRFDQYCPVAVFAAVYVKFPVVLCGCGPADKRSLSRVSGKCEVLHAFCGSKWISRCKRSNL